jgi:hypothetical protein
MFHQANLRQGDTPTITVGSQTGRLSLLQIWVETITQELVRLYVINIGLGIPHGDKLTIS